MPQLGADGARMWRIASLYGVLGMEMAIAVLLGTWAGERLDGWLHCRPWGALGGFCVGVGAAVLSVVRAMQRARLLMGGAVPKALPDPLPPPKPPADRRPPDAER